VAAQSLALRPDGVQLYGSAAQYGALSVDLAFGGAYYGIVNAAELGVRIVPDQADELRRVGAAITEVLRRDHTPAHPLDADLSFVYGTIIVDLDPKTSPDGLATRAPELGLVVLGADCLPVLLWRRDEPAVAAAHAGWRGLVAGVLGEAVRSLGRPERVGAAIGPGVGPCCYPVSQEVRDRFAAAFGGAVLRPPAVDLAAAARAALVAEGVPDGAVVTIEACTSCEAGRFFSHRRDGESSGRQAGLVWAAA